MRSSRFHVLLPQTPGAQADPLERVYPFYRARRAYDAALGRLARLCYDPVWRGTPLMLDGRPAGGDIAQLLDDLRRGESQMASAQSRPAAIPVARPYDDWKRQAPFSRRQAIIELVQEHVARRPAAIRSCLLHGSLADGRIADGFSDCDLMVFLRPASEMSPAGLLEAARWILRTNRYLLRYNPCMHHGPMIVAEGGQTFCREAIVPRVLIEKGVWLAEPIGSLAYIDDDLERLAAPAALEWFFEDRIAGPSDIRSAFDALWWASSVLLLPLLEHQIRTGRAGWKRDVLATCADHQDLIASLTQVRLRLGQWIAQRLPDPVWPAADDLNPGVCLAYYKTLLAMRPRDLDDIGITPRLINRGRELFEHVSTVALESHARRLAACEKTTVDRLIAWPAAVKERPAPLPMAAYDRARAQVLLRAARCPGVVAVYEFGNIGCPGLSDLDLLVLLADDFHGLCEDLTIKQLEPDVAAVLSHDPLFAAASLAQVIGGVFPIFSARQILGRELPLRPTGEFALDVRACLYSFKNSLKCPRDILWLARQREVRWQTLLAYLNSFGAVSRCLGELAIDVPPSVGSCIELSQRVRADFAATGHCRLSDLRASIDLMLGASADLMLALDGFWRARFPDLDAALGPFAHDAYRASIQSAIRYGERDYPPEPPALPLMRQLVQQHDPPPALPAPIASRLAAFAGPAIELRRQFIQTETAAGRRVSEYIAGRRS